MSEHTRCWLAIIVTLAVASVLIFWLMPFLAGRP